MTAGDGPAAGHAPSGAATTTPGDDPKLKAFLASAVFVLPWLTWQAWVLGASFRQRRGKPVADTNALAEGAAALAEGAAATKAAAARVAAARAAAATGDAADADDAADTDDDEAINTEDAANNAAAPPQPPSSSRGRPILFMAGASLLFLLAKAWLARVLALVPEPYLDEFFHVPQAQTYCAGRWREWDDKITTPPGLYLVSVALRTLWSGVEDGCSVWALRGANSVAIMLVAVAASSCRAALEHQARPPRQQQQARENQSVFFSFYAFHTALNVALFPVLFFFSALYYTDVYSTLAVLLAYRVHLFRAEAAALTSASPPFWTDLLAVAVGLATLLMRQTNIFWVVLYLGGLEAVTAVKAVRRRNAAVLAEHREATFDSLSGMLRLYAWRYAHGDVHDPPLGVAWPDDWLLSLVSVGVAATCNPAAVLRRAWPYAAVLAGFAGFVAWNGGVVLGDKANHVATLHAAQLLYLWPLFAFFSAPLFAAHALHYAKLGWQRLAGTTDEGDGTEEDAPASPVTRAAFPDGPEGGAGPSKLLRALHVVFVKKGYYPVYLVAVFDAMVAVVRYNTLVHPFTLADNRHYMFYVFRYTIRRGVVLRYALVPVYALCGWAVWRVLWGCGSGNGSGSAKADAYVSSPFAAKPAAVLPAEGEKGAQPAPEDKKQQPKARREKEKAKKAKGKGKGKGKKAVEVEEEEEAAPPEADSGPPAIFLSFLDEDADGAASASRAGPPTSAALLWLLATSLSLVTAPLVEPRYFILPWVFWRLLVPAVGSSSTKTPPQQKSLLSALAAKVDGRLALETLWFVAVNVATMYVFLFRPFVWRGADGSLLDGGRLQRFMW